MVPPGYPGGSVHSRAEVLVATRHRGLPLYGPDAPGSAAMQADRAHLQWVMHAVIDRLRPILSPEDSAPLVAPVAALSFADKVAALDDLPTWRPTVPQSLDSSRGLRTRGSSVAPRTAAHLAVQAVISLPRTVVSGIPPWISRDGHRINATILYIWYDLALAKTA